MKEKFIIFKENFWFFVIFFLGVIWFFAVMLFWLLFIIYGTGDADSDLNNFFGM